MVTQPVTTTAVSEQASFVDLIESLITKPIQSTLRLDDIVGNRDILMVLNNLMLQAKERFDWVDPNDTAMTSFLLFGPPGCGRTSISQALAHVNGWTFFHVTEGKLKSKRSGDSEK